MSFDYRSYQSDIALIVNHAELVRKAMEMGYSRPIHARNGVLTEEQLETLQKSGKCAAVVTFDPGNDEAGAQMMHQLDQHDIPCVRYDVSFTDEDEPASLDEAVREFPTIKRLTDIMIDR